MITLNAEKNLNADQLRNLLKEERSQRAVERDSASLILHDVKNRLTALQISVELSKNPELTEGDLAFLNDMTHRSSKSMGDLLELLEQVLSANEQIVGSIELIELCQRIASMQSESFIGTGVQFLPKRVQAGIFVQASSSIVIAIATTIIDNALIACKQSGKFEPTVEMAPLIDDDYAYIVITDSGRGFSPADKEKAFNHGYSNHGERKGKGLGLCLSARLIGTDNVIIDNAFDPIDQNVISGAKVSIRLPLVK